MKRTLLGGTLLTVVNVGLWAMLGFQQPGGAAPPQGQPPFLNAVEQRQQMIAELQEIKLLLREQNALLRTTGKAPEARNAR